VEAALVMSMILSVTFGAVEYGFAFYVKHSIQGAAYVGARSAITTGSTNAIVNTAVAASMTSAGFNSSQYTVTTNPSTIAGVASGTYITVTVACTWSNVGISPLPTSLGGLAANKQLSCNVVMAHE
jgi:Flp pilus assembly protein TadG